MLATMLKTMAAAVLAVIVTVAAVPAWSAETATFNDTARFLAGLPPSPDSPLAPLTKDPAWQQHARYFDQIFAREEARLSKVRAFSKEYLTEKHETMLYMFSGPDFLYATSFFPNASTYVMAGLEPSGDIPQLTNLSRGTVFSSLRNLESSMGSLLSYSFFITKNMKTQLHEGPVYGTIPVLYVFMARTGKTIHDVSLVGLDTDGKFITADGPAADGGDAKSDGKGDGKADVKKVALRSIARSAAPGVKIVFSDGNGPKQTLYYFSTNLSDGSVERSGFMAFVETLPPADAFIKSASYLLHSGSFSKVRGMLLDRSATVLEDDSGIPLAYFDQKKWRLQPFGRYVGPLGIFGHSFQPGMSELFRHATPIEFGIGYRWRHNESNLLLAQKGAPRTSDQELTPASPTPQDDAQAPKKTKKGSQTRRTYKTGYMGCRYGGVFPFCSDNPHGAAR
jgi:hypothetical protein